MEPHRGDRPPGARQAPRRQAAQRSRPQLHGAGRRRHSGGRRGRHGHRGGQAAGLHLGSRLHQGQPPRRQVPARRGLLFSDGSEADKTAVAAASAPLTSAGITTAEAEQGTTDAGEALRARILQQAEQQQDSADAEAKAAQEKEAAEKAAAEAKKQKDEAKAKAEAEKKKAEEEAKKKAEALRLAKLAAGYAIPTSSYTITSTFGEAGSMWSSGHHTGLDFAAPTGTPIKAIHSGTVKSAGWSGAYGYRTVLELDDGTELWFCHQSSIGVGVGQKVSTGETIGRVGATGNVTGPHLHLEVHTAGGTGIDPMAWLRGKGLNP